MRLKWRPGVPNAMPEVIEARDNHRLMQGAG
jgi:hypothetical protein